MNAYRFSLVINDRHFFINIHVLFPALKMKMAIVLVFLLKILFVGIRYM